MGIDIKFVCGSDFKSKEVSVRRSANEEEMVIFREFNFKEGDDVLDVYLNKGGKKIFSYDFSDPCYITKEGKSWLKRSGRLEKGVSFEEAAKKVVDSYYEHFD